MVIASIEDPEDIAKVLVRLEKTAPDQSQPELPLGARARGDLQRQAAVSAVPTGGPFHERDCAAVRIKLPIRQDDQQFEDKQSFHGQARTLLRMADAVNAACAGCCSGEGRPLLVLRGCRPGRDRVDFPGWFGIEPRRRQGAPRETWRDRSQPRLKGHCRLVRSAKATTSCSGTT